jgi:hypothetical protein
MYTLIIENLNNGKFLDMKLRPMTYMEAVTMRSKMTNFAQRVIHIRKI